MTQRTSRLLILAVTLFLIAAPTVVFVWRAGVWSERGIAGLGYFQDTPEQRESPMPKIGIFDRQPGEVLASFPSTPAARAGIEAGDTIVSIDGIPIRDLDRLRDLDEAARTGSTLRYEWIHSGEPRGADLVLISPLDSNFTRFATITDALVGLVFLGISFLVYWTKPGSRWSLIFYLMSAAGSATFFLNALAQLEITDQRGILPGGLNVSAFAFFVGYISMGIVLISLLLHLSLIFPRARPLVKEHPATTTWVYLAPFLPMLGTAALLATLQAMDRSAPFWVVMIVVITALVLALRAIWKQRQGGLFKSILNHPWLTLTILLSACGIAGPVFRVGDRDVFLVVLIALFLGSFAYIALVSIAYLLLTCLALVSAYRESGVEEKRQVRWPLWGTGVATGVLGLLWLGYLVLLNVAPNFVPNHPSIGIALGIVTKILFLLIPISFAFGIVKYRLMDIDFIIRKTFVYAGVTGFVLISYLLLVGVAGATLVSFAGVQSQTVTILSTLVIALLLVPVRNQIQKLLDQKVFRQKYDYDDARALIRREVLEARELVPLMSSIVQHVQQASQTRSVVIFTRDPERGRFSSVATIGLPDELASSLGFEDRHPLLEHADRVIDPTSDPLTDSEKVVLRRSGASIAVLARLKGETVAVLTAGKKLDGTPFDEDDYAFLSDVSDQVSLAVGNLEARPEEIEFAQAREIQRSLLPTSIPQIDGYQIAALWKPAKEVSGDYYDVLRYEGQRIGLCIGDVAGKGMPAALLMSSLQAAVKAIAPTEAPPDKVCTQVRRVVCQNLSGGKFVTFFYALYDGETRTFSYTNCGHNAPILVRRDGTVTALETGGAVIGRLFADSPLELGTVSLSRGDRVLLFTDGVSEARNADDEDFGEDRIAQLVRDRIDLSAADLVDEVAATITAYAGEFQDDFTLLVFAAD